MYLNGKKIKALREAKGLTQAQLAKRLGLHQSTFSHIENGIKPLDCGRLEILANILGVREGEILRDYEF